MTVLVSGAARAARSMSDVAVAGLARAGFSGAIVAGPRQAIIAEGGDARDRPVWCTPDVLRSLSSA